MEPTRLEQRKEALDRTGTEVDPAARLRAYHRRARHCVDPLQPMVEDAARAPRIEREPRFEHRQHGMLRGRGAVDVHVPPHELAQRR
jgi:hypothetical protein